MYDLYPRQLHLELTDHCNAKCPMCSRTIDPIKHNSSLDLNTIKKAFSNYIFSEIKYCGNDGDPLMSKDLLSIIHFFSPAKQIIHTNGSLQNENFWKSLAQIQNVEVIFAIDGSNKQSHEKYRIGTQFEKIIKNAKIFNSHGGKSFWQFIVFEHNKGEIEEARQLAKQLGFYRFEEVYSHRDSVDDLAPVRINNSSNNKLDCKALRRQEIYVRANGEVFPCVYQGVRKNKSNLNIKDLEFKKIVNSDYFVDFNFMNPICHFNCVVKNRNSRMREVL